MDDHHFFYINFQMAMDDQHVGCLKNVLKRNNASLLAEPTNPLFV
jgi:hypothetical protein